ncbi:hypothetical protein FPJ27_19630 [Burkholderia sp. MS455]|uniref:hypothetical protein n=1 Tax=Burkholderia sp. MS455 TaxID=2811788 RepID=UPI001959ED53|nr:hypothetical protein [Burkholderia sp. MS455]QRR08575.1 hypothetical protein FPJ27_19630 [Burkholderia sp. MS455]
MSSADIPTNPKKSRFGYPRVERLEAFKNATNGKSDATERVKLQGQIRTLPIVTVPVNVPKYRLENGRTASAQVEYLAKNKDVRSDLFTGDTELLDAQEAQHKLLVKLADKEDLRKFFEDPKNKQEKVILLDHNGFVVNGNRRLATWRELHHEDPVKYSHFEYIEVVILPQVDDRAINRLEAELQIEPDIKADYTWDAEANMMRAKQVREKYTTKELAELYGKKDGYVEELLDMREYADEWLKSRAKENMWSEVSGSELAFRRIVSTRPKVGNAGRQDLFKKAAFVLIDDPKSAGDSLHDAINNLANYLEPIVGKLQNAFDVKPPPSDDAVEELFGGGRHGISESLDLAIALEISKETNSAKAREIIVDHIESERQKKRETKSANKLFDCCTKANSMLQEACMSLTPEAKIIGVEKQLDQIEQSISKIRAHLIRGKK